MQNQAPALSRGLAILNLICQSEHPISHQEISESLSIPKATCSRLLSVLKEGRYLVQEKETNRYLPGPGLLALQPSSNLETNLSRAAVPLQKRLSTELQISVILFAVEEDKLKVLSKEVFPGQPVMRELGAVSNEIPELPWGMLLYHGCDAPQKVRIRQSSDSPDHLDALYNEWRSHFETTGCGLDRATRLPSVYRFGAPIMNLHGQIIGILGAGTYSENISEARIQKISRALSTAAKEIAHHLFGTDMLT